jgi:prolipoprotein diacylglyceryltransferase
MPTPRGALLIHTLFEAAAFAAGFAVYRRQAAASRARRLPDSHDLGLLAGAALGALAGSRLLAWADAGPAAFTSGAWTGLGGKTIVGGILGGWIGVELAKRLLGVARPTGDAFAFPVIAGIAVGRIGCFAAGLSDGTYGLPTSLPWGIDLGDGVRRHPTPLYEIAFVLLLAFALSRASRRPRPAGELFLVFAVAYLSFRFGVDYLKPRRPVFAGAGVLQLVALAGAAAAAAVLVRRRTAIARIAAQEAALA